MSERANQGIYFYRINNYNTEINQFIEKYYDNARKMGVILEGKIPNPNDQNIDFYTEKMGPNFYLDNNFIDTSLRQWLPRLSLTQRCSVANSMYKTLERLQKSGKSLDMLKNTYIKFMCWLYYKFERIITQLGQDDVPKILYEGEISQYELLLLNILAGAGCDVVLLQYKGDTAYQRIDRDLIYSIGLKVDNAQPFPSDFSLKKIRENAQDAFKLERLYGTKPQISGCINQWITTQNRGLTDFITPYAERGSQANLFYNIIYKIRGVEDRITYLNELYQFYLEVRKSQKKLLIIEGGIETPDPDEINNIQRQNYGNIEQLIVHLSRNIQWTGSIELERLMNKAFVDVLIEESKKSELNLNKLLNKAIYLLCWLKRYQLQLFANWHMPQTALLILMGGCKSENEALFIKMLSNLPVDILILQPNLNNECCLNDEYIYNVKYENTLEVDKFPEENGHVHMGTTAYHAERDLDEMLYQDTGMYRNQQYGQANALNLKTMYEEIAILWEQETKFRPNFSTIDNKVNIPVVFAKVCGVKDGASAPYWKGVKSLVNDETFVIQNVPFISPETENPMKAYTHDFFKRGKVQFHSIKSHPQYPYSFLRDTMQDHILYKLQILIDSKIIKGTFETGVEHTIVATVFNLPKEIIRLLQQFDFTKKNPKLIYINTGENIISLQDTIFTAFLSLVGFDVLYLVPTGYQNIEQHFNKIIFDEHQIGQYMYDLSVPNLTTFTANSAFASLKEKGGKFLREVRKTWD
ncbi:MAG: hypothetical protein ATN36_03370 [Epulopiscium sp. Nele67-Bin005]|nr:MAG: hypothetical protein ATN36_03370 [Epulopiscium sp. Nele67-Bin005]